MDNFRQENNLDQFDKAGLFKQVVEMGSMAAVARATDLSPSVITKRIAELEASLGVQLLTRTTRKIALTEAGSYFYSHVCSLNGQWQSLLDETTSLGTEPQGILTVAAPQPVLSRVLVPLLPEFRRRYPRIQLMLKTALYQELPDRQADLSFARELVNFDSATVIAAPVCQYQNSLFASPAYLADAGIPESLEQLSVHAGLIYGGLNDVRQEGGKWHFESGEVAELKVAIRSDNTEALISAAVAGMGIVYIPEMIIQHELGAGLLRLVLPELKSEPHRALLYYQQQTHVAQKIRVFIDYLRESLGKVRLSPAGSLA